MPPKRSKTRTSDSFAKRLEAELVRYGITQISVANRLGISQGTVSGWFNRGYVPQPRILFDLADMLGVRPEWLLEGKEPKLNERSQRVGEQVITDVMHLPSAALSVFRESASDYKQKGVVNAVPYPAGVRMIPVLSWAQAGQAVDFAQMPDEWLELIPAAVTDDRAFAVQLRGDSMEPKYSDGDVAIVLPNTPPRNGDLVIANIKEEGTAFKLMFLVGGDPEKIRLKSYNPTYDPMDYHRDDFHWIRPVLSVNKIVRR
jgi:phage repressor protein C with HTH and peptisase S24 domain